MPELTVLKWPERPTIPSDSTPWLHWYRGEVLHDGRLEQWGFIVCRKTPVGVVAVDADRRLGLVRQWRYPLGQELLEIPKGFCEGDEAGDPPSAACRELAEELGVKGEMTSLGELVAAPGLGEIRHQIYLARGLTTASAKPDIGERLQPVWIPLTDVPELIRSHGIIDSVSLAALYIAQLNGSL